MVWKLCRSRAEGVEKLGKEPALKGGRDQVPKMGPSCPKPSIMLPDDAIDAEGGRT